jgi:hypothetical protein
MQLIEVAKATAEGLGLAGSALWMDQHHVGIRITSRRDPVGLHLVQETAGWLVLRHHHHPIAEASERCPDEQELSSRQATERIEQLDAGTVKVPWAIDKLLTPDSLSGF